MFDGAFYLQVTGCVYGREILPVTNIYMSWWEHQYIFCTHNPFRESLVWYGRYIDDILILWG